MAPDETPDEADLRRARENLDALTPDQARGQHPPGAPTESDQIVGSPSQNDADSGETDGDTEH